MEKVDSWRVTHQHFHIFSVLTNSLLQVTHHCLEMGGTYLSAVLSLQ